MANEGFQKFQTAVKRTWASMRAEAAAASEKRKLQHQIRAGQKEINKIFRDLGEMAYTQWVNKAADAEAMTTVFRSLQEKFAAQEQRRKQIQQVEENLAQQLAALQEPEEPVAAKCSGCGAEYTAVVNFCRLCGAPVAAVEESQPETTEVPEAPEVAPEAAEEA